MQNRYVGDVGDFGKYGLLRALCREGLRLGVVWYLTRPTPQERAKGDGGLIGYLDDTVYNSKHYRACDEALWDALAKIVHEKRRNVKSIRKDEVLGKGCTFYEKRLFYCRSWSSERRRQFRSAWLKGALEKTAKCTAVFLDPDNGFQTPALREFRRLGPKYVLFNEARPYLERGQSLIVYQHSNFSKTVDLQIQEMFCRIHKELPIGARPFAMPYRRGTSRTYFILPSCEEHHKALWDRAVVFAQGLWGKHGHFDQPIKSPL